MIASVDEEVRRDSERQPEHADNVFDDPVCRRGRQHLLAIAQAPGVIGRQPALLLQRGDSPVETELVQTG